MSNSKTKSKSTSKTKSKSKSKAKLKASKKMKDRSSESTNDGSLRASQTASDSSIGSTEHQSTCREGLSVFVLFLINFLNYSDRFALAGVLTDVQTYFDVDDAMTGLLQTVFIIFYMLSALLCGYLGDRHSRKCIILCGLFLWVSAVFASSFTPKNLFYAFVASRGVVGIGEATIVTLGPSIISDMFVADMRGRALMVFFLAGPLGSGFGYMFGGHMNSLLDSWVWALRLSPIFSLFGFVLLLSVIREPQRGQAELATGAQTVTGVATTPFYSDVFDLLRIPTYVFATVAFTGVAFSMVSLSWWAPITVCDASAMNAGLNSTEGLDSTARAHVNTIFGMITIIGGLTGVITGSVWSQMWSNGKHCFRWIKTRNAHCLVCAIGSFSAGPLLFTAVHNMNMNMNVAWILIFLTLVASCLNFAIGVELCMDVVTPERRSVANALQMFISNLFGGAIGPVIVGVISDAVRGSNNSPPARFNALRISFHMLACAFMIAGLLYSVASLFFKRDHAKFRQEMGYVDETVEEKSEQNSTKKTS